MLKPTILKHMCEMFNTISTFASTLFAGRRVDPEVIDSQGRSKGGLARSKTTLLCLPPEIHEAAFSSLDKQSLCAISLTCHALNPIATDLLWRYYQFPPLRNYTQHDLVPSINAGLIKIQYIREFTVAAYRAPGAVFQADQTTNWLLSLQPFAGRFVSLSKMEIRSIGDIWPADLVLLLHEYPALRELHLAGVHVTEHTKGDITLPHLDILQISSYHENSGTPTLGDFPIRCPNLRGLTIRTGEIPLKVTELEMINRLRKLRKLEISGVLANNLTLEGIPDHLSDLEHLVLHHFTTTRVDWFGNFFSKPLPLLKSLRTTFKGVAATEVAYITKAIQQRKYPGLKQLRIGGTEFLRSPEFERLYAALLAEGFTAHPSRYSFWR